MLCNENETLYTEISIPAYIYKKAKKAECETKYTIHKKLWYMKHLSQIWQNLKFPGKRLASPTWKHTYLANAHAYAWNNLRYQETCGSWASQNHK